MHESLKQQDPSNYRSAIWCRLLDLMKIYWRLDIAGSGCFTVAVGFATVLAVLRCDYRNNPSLSVMATN